MIGLTEFFMIWTVLSLTAMLIIIKADKEDIEDWDAKAWFLVTLFSVFWFTLVLYFTFDILPKMLVKKRKWWFTK